MHWAVSCQPVVLAASCARGGNATLFIGSHQLTTPIMDKFSLVKYDNSRQTIYTYMNTTGTFRIYSGGSSFDRLLDVNLGKVDDFFVGGGNIFYKKNGLLYVHNVVEKNTQVVKNLTGHSETVLYVHNSVSTLSSLLFIPVTMLIFATRHS
jgi:hypothetical protein